MLRICSNIYAVVIPSEEAEAVKTRQRDKGIYYAAYDAFHAAKNGGDEVKPEKADKPPVYSTKYNQRQTNVVPCS
jgi:hypothetical protein